MTTILESRKDAKTECPCCGVKIKPCPRCGKQGCIIGNYENAVFCEDDMGCGIEMNYGHWCGEQDGKPAIHFVIEGWNERPLSEETLSEEQR